MIPSVDDEREKQELCGSLDGSVIATTSLDNNLIISSKIEDEHSLHLAILQKFTDLCMTDRDRMLIWLLAS